MHPRQQESGHREDDGPGRWISVGVKAMVLFAFWLALSGRFAPAQLIMGALGVVLVLALNRDVSHLRPVTRRRGLRETLLIGWRRFAYLGWLLYAIVVANIQVAYLVLHPRMPIDPVLLRFRVPWRGEATQTVLANSITLTPGTVTVDLRDGEYTVHSLAPSMAQPLTSGRMQMRVAAMFEEEAEEDPAYTMVRSVGDLER
jgi:multicomponent Na+:H+ antiporter subunit E